MPDIVNITCQDGTEEKLVAKAETFCGQNLKGKNCPSIKTHANMKLNSLTMNKHSFTNGVGDERKEVPVESLKLCLNIADIGYKKHELIFDLDNQDTKIIHRMPSNSCPVMLQARSFKDGKYTGDVLTFAEHESIF